MPETLNQNEAEVSEKELDNETKNKENPIPMSEKIEDPYKNMSPKKNNYMKLFLKILLYSGWVALLFLVLTFIKFIFIFPFLLCLILFIFGLFFYSIKQKSIWLIVANLFMLLCIIITGVVFIKLFTMQSYSVYKYSEENDYYLYEYDTNTNIDFSIQKDMYFSYGMLSITLFGLFLLIFNLLNIKNVNHNYYKNSTKISTGLVLFIILAAIIAKNFLDRSIECDYCQSWASVALYLLFIMYLLLVIFVYVNQLLWFNKEYLAIYDQPVKPNINISANEYESK